MAVTDLFLGWFWFAAVAFGIITAIVAFVYMLGSLLMNDKMKTWAKMEISEMVYSAIILAMVIPGLTIVDSVVQGSLGVTNEGSGAIIAAPNSGGPSTSLTYAWIPVSQTNAIGVTTKVSRQLDICASGTEALVPYLRNIPSCHIKLGIWYMNEMFDEAKNYAFDIYISYIWTSMLAEFTINKEYVFEKSGFFNFNPWRGFFTTSNTIKSLLFDWALKVLMLLKFQEVFMRFVAVAMFPVFYVLGALLRAFTFTRRLGGLLLAIAISLYFIFPAFYAFGAIVIIQLKLAASTQWSMSNAYAVQSNPDPPIGNLIYTRGSYPMVGGALSTEQAHQALAEMEGMSETEFLKNMEQGGANSNTPYMPSFDLNDKSRTPDASSVQSAWNTYSSWFTNASKKSREDNFVTLAFTDGGFIDSLGRITFWSVFFALLSLIATIAGIRSLATTFGGDIEIAGLTRLI